MKKDSAMFYEYLKNMPLTVLETMYKKSEVLAELFSGILKSLKEHGLKEDPQHVCEFLVTLAKAQNFDMTLMFIDKQEKQDIKEILTTLKKQDGIDKASLSKFESIYGSI
jgi:hypothetical protein